MTSESKKNECVILLHGLARTHRSMLLMEKVLQLKGYQVVNINYPSRELPIDELSELVIKQSLEKCDENTESIHFVTHSLGGILVRYYLQHQRIRKLRRVVMLGPPNQGSEVVDKLRDLPVFSLLNGPAGLQLGTSENDIPKKLKPVNFELGIIAGKHSINLFLSSLIPGADDGKVSVESTKAAGMKDFIAMPTTHTFMMINPFIIRQTLLFLEQGQFDHPAKDEPIEQKKH